MLDENTEEFDYVVARKLANDTLSFYTYGTEIIRGDLESARYFLDYVKRQSPRDTWKIYRLEYKEIA